MLLWNVLLPYFERKAYTKCSSVLVMGNPKERNKFVFEDDFSFDRM